MQERSQSSSSIYSTLPSSDPGKNHIRVLNILPGQVSDIVRCELHVITLEEAPPYEALSYVWGDPNPPDWIICNHRRKQVTPNLAAALRKLRFQNEPRLVWIDALCVNQDDLDERSQHVKLMKEIYSRTCRVVVWLGEGNGQAEEAIDIIEKAAACCADELGKSLEEIRRDSFNIDIEHETPGFPETEERRLKRDLPLLGWDDDDGPSPWDSVAWLYDHAWFTRAWIIQEVAFTPAIMYVGAHQVDWTSVGIAARWIMMKSYVRVFDTFQKYRQAMGILYASFMVGQPFGQQLGFLSPQATDPRDQVFALVGLSDEACRSSRYMQPDYTKDTASVYMDAVRHIIEQNVPGAGLPKVFEQVSSYPSVQDEHFPSWVPRWDLTFPTETLENAAEDSPWKAGGSSVEEIATTTDARVLSIKGLTLTQFIVINNALCTPGVPNAVRVLWDETSPLLAIRGETDALKTAFAQTITAGNTLKIGEESRLFNADDLDDYLSCRTGEDLCPQASSLDRSHVARRAFDFEIGVRDLPFFITTNYFIGVSTKAVERGDIISIFYGHRFPYVLRPAGAQYKFLGPCYVHGYMHGEAMQELKAGMKKEEWFELI